MIWSVAWRNIWRNPVRSWVIIAAVTVGMFAGVFTSTFTKGWLKQRLQTGVETEVSYIQVHHPGFGDNYDLKMDIPDGKKVSDSILSIEGVNGTSPRIVLQSMVSSAETGTGVKIIGVVPEREKTTSNLYTYVKEGDYFESVPRNPVVIGKKLAEKLKVKLHSKIVVTVHDAEGNITSGAFRICGIYDSGNNMFEELNLFVRYDDLKSIAQLEDGVAHEIMVHISDPEKLEPIKALIAAANKNYLVQTWKEVTPELGYINEIGDMYTYIFIVIILLALGFGIVNTMLMVVLERVKELGMLMAVGMAKPKVFTMIMLETIMLTTTGGILGIILGVSLTVATAKHGINLSMYAEGLEGMGYASRVFPAFDAGMVIGVSVLVILTGIIASVYPARKALKYNPADALRIDM